MKITASVAYVRVI